MSQPFPAQDLIEAGLNRHAIFDIDALPASLTETWDARGRQLILIGHGGKRLWEAVKAAGLSGDDPIDDFTVATLHAWFARHLPGHVYRILYPGDAPLGLQALGALAGWHHPSPFMVGIDTEWGSWFAYRAVVIADTRFEPSQPVDRSNPCNTCTETPCISHCPAGAPARAGFDLQRCIAYRQSAGSACSATCLARLACPVGTEHSYDADQMHHTYSRSLQLIEKFSRQNLA